MFIRGLISKMITQLNFNNIKIFLLHLSDADIDKMENKIVYRCENMQHF